MRRTSEQPVPVTVRVIIVLTAVALASCASPLESQRVFELVFIVEADPGVHLARAQVFVDGDPVGKSDSNGRVAAEILGQSGQKLRISHDCPAGHEAPSEPKGLRLRSFEGLARSQPRGMEITLRCRPVKRLVAFVVRAKEGPDVPVLLNGEQLTRTNGSGVAHFSLRGAPGTEYTVELDTREHPRLLPRSPAHLFTLADADEIFVVRQSFEVEKAPQRRSHRRARITKIE